MFISEMLEGLKSMLGDWWRKAPIITAVLVFFAVMIGRGIVGAIWHAVSDWRFKRRMENDRERQRKQMERQAELVRQQEEQARKQRWREAAIEMEREQRQLERDVAAKVDHFINSKAVKECADIIRKQITVTPYDMKIEVYAHQIDCSGPNVPAFHISFYEIRYQNLADKSDIAAFAKALAAHLGHGFRYEGCVDYHATVHYETKPLRSM